MTAPVLRLLAAARRATESIPPYERNGEHQLFDVAIAMAEVSDPDGPAVVAEIERRLGDLMLDASWNAYVATLYARFGLRAEVEARARTVRKRGFSPNEVRFLAEAYERLGDYARVDELDPDAYSLAGALERGDHDRVVKRLDHALARLDETSVDGHRYVADLLAKLDRRAEALDHIRRAERAWKPEKHQDLGESLAKLADEYAKLDALPDAVRVAEQAEARAGERLPLTAPKRKSGRPRAHRPDYLSHAIPIVARIHERAGDHARAVALVDAHVRELVGIQSVAAQARAARMYTELGEHAKADRWLRQPDEVTDDALQAGYAHARLAASQPVTAIEHAARITSCKIRVEALLAIARWLHEHGVGDEAAMNAAIDRLQ